jgi:hypothetical protein
MANIQFHRSKLKTDASFLDLLTRNFGATFTSTLDATNWLNKNQYYYSYVNTYTPPAYNQVSRYLDGSIIDVSGSKYFVDKKAGNNVLINDYDFPTGWTKGFPYKSAATIDIFGQTGVPVVSLYQNFDYGNQYFTKHEAQILDINGVEIYQPRISEIVEYSEALTSDNLSSANSYFDVPSEVLTALWVTKTGNDTTGNGSKATPYLTINKAASIVSANGTIYVRSGVYTEMYSASYNLLVNVGGDYIATGLCTVKAGGSYARVVTIYGNNTINFQGFIVDCESTKAYGISFELGTKTVNRCKIVNETTKCCYMSSGALLKNSILFTTPYLRYNVTLSGNFIKSAGSNYSLATDYNATGVTFNFYYNSINPVSCSGTSICYLDGSATFNIKFNTFDITNVPANPLFYFAASKTQTINIEFNYIFSSATHSSPTIWNQYASNLGVSTIRNNIFEFTSIGDFANNCIIKLQGKVSPIIDKNIFKMATHYSQVAVQILSTGSSCGSPQITNNRFISYSDNAYVIQVGEEATSARDNMITPIITGNLILGEYDFGGSASGSKHCIFVGFNVNPIISYNYVSGDHIGIVVKHLGGVYDSALIIGNLFENCDRGILVKGVNGAKLYNNTIVSNIAGSDGIETETTATETSNLVIKNNIIKTVSWCIKITNGAQVGLISDNNVLVGNSFYYMTATITYSAWKALGFDSNSTDNDPVLINLIPTIPITGIALGAAYDEGLDISTNWGSDTTLPNVVTKQQGANWDIGAYVH